jgi:hypothetical protein
LTGAPRRLSPCGTIAGCDWTLIDPAAVLLVKDPEGEQPTLAPVCDSEGKYHFDVLASLPGRWH